jgi:hypothetical protein
MAGSYTRARGYEDTFGQINGVDALRINDPLQMLTSGEICRTRARREPSVRDSARQRLFNDNKVVGAIPTTGAFRVSAPSAPAVVAVSA